MLFWSLRHTDTSPDFPRFSHIPRRARLPRFSHLAEAFSRARSLGDLPALLPSPKSEPRHFGHSEPKSCLSASNPAADPAPTSALSTHSGPSTHLRPFGPAPFLTAVARGVRQTARRFTAAVLLVSAGMEGEELEREDAEPEAVEGIDEKPEAVEEQEESEEAVCGAKKRVVPGIVYLGHLPPRFRPLHVRNLLSAYGEVGRVFFQPEGKSLSQALVVRGGGWRLPASGLACSGPRLGGGGHGTQGRRPAPVGKPGLGVGSSVSTDESTLHTPLS